MYWVIHASCRKWENESVIEYKPKEMTVIRMLAALLYEQQTDATATAFHDSVGYFWLKKTSRNIFNISKLRK